jgi:hypothetical protein
MALNPEVQMSPKFGVSGVVFSLKNLAAWGTRG